MKASGLGDQRDTILYEINTITREMKELECLLSGRSWKHLAMKSKEIAEYIVKQVIQTELYPWVKNFKMKMKRKWKRHNVI